MLLHPILPQGTCGPEGASTSPGLLSSDGPRLDVSASQHPIHGAVVREVPRSLRQAGSRRSHLTGERWEACPRWGLGSWL